MPGVIRTRVGYAGGNTQNPTYHALGGHSETIQIDYDPSRITYQDLLAAFWEGHDPAHRSWSRQYASIIFAHNEEQKRLAEASRARIGKVRGIMIHTEIIPYNGFTLAENYHQKHSLQQFPELRDELQRIYPDPAVYVASAAVARVNGYVGGEGSYEELLREIDGFGLSTAGKENLLELVQRRKSGATCPTPLPAEQKRDLFHE
jgi:peptide-methionine (S)-S-oxide reductase